MDITLFVKQAFLGINLSKNMYQYVIFLTIFVIFYLFIIRPQQKKNKEQKTFFDTLKKGDKVVTIGGVHGSIYSIEQRLIVLVIDHKGSKLTVEKQAISPELTTQYLERLKEKS